MRQLALAGVAMVGASAAWPVAVSLWPGSTPYIGGSTDGTVWDLIVGYNGLGRITGSEGGAGGQGTSFGGAAGLWRMFNEQVGGQVAWLLPLAASVLGTAALAVVLIGRTADFAPALRVAVPLAAAVTVLASAGLRMSGSRARVLLTVAAVAGTIAVTAGPASYSVASVGRALSGNNVLAGPASVSATSGGGGGARPSGTGGPPSGTAPTGAQPTGASTAIAGTVSPAATGATTSDTSTGTAAAATATTEAAAPNASATTDGGRSPTR